MNNRSHWLVVYATMAVIAGLLVAGALLTPDLNQVTIGSQLPDFRVTDLGTGEPVTLADVRGEVVLLNVWATNCPPCEQEMPSIQRAHDELAPEGLRVLAVSVDRLPEDFVRDWLERRNLTIPVAFDRDHKISDALQMTGLPETFLINRRGEIVFKMIGPDAWDHPAHLRRIRMLLREVGDVS